MANKLWAGLDVGSRTTSVCVIDEAGDILHEAVCPTDVMSIHSEIAFLRRRRFARVGLETGPGFHLARGLVNRGYSVDIYEARQLSKFLRLRRNKTDAGDANGIAQAGRLGAPLVSRVHLKSFESEGLAARLRIRRFLVRDRNRAHRLLSSQIALLGGELTSHVRSATLQKEAEREIARLCGKSSPLSRDLKRLLQHLVWLLQEEVSLNRELVQLAQENDVCRRLMAVPGVGPICSLSFVAAIDEPGRFTKTAAIGPYLGLTPMVRQSGLSKRTGRISKMGNRNVRGLLMQSSVRFMSCTSDELELHAWTSRLEQRRGKGKSRVALARKLATIMIAIWKNGQEFRPRRTASSPSQTI